MKNLIILSVLLLIAVSGYAQNISGSLNEEQSSAIQPVPAAYNPAENSKADFRVLDNPAVTNIVVGIAADDNTTGILKAEAEIEQASSYKSLPAFGINFMVTGEQGGGTDLTAQEKVKSESNLQAIPAFDKNVPFEYVPQEESTIPEKAVEAL